MRTNFARVIASGFALMLSTATPALAKDGKWVCTKDGQEVAVKGKKAADKKKDCEGQGGTWEKAKAAAEHGAADAQQSSGGGGSW